MPDGVGHGVLLRGGDLLVEDAVGGVRAVVVFLAQVANLFPFLGNLRRRLRLPEGGYLR